MTARRPLVLIDGLAAELPTADTLSPGGEGTFTPTILFGGAAVGVTYITQLGRYTRIGNRVFFDIRLVLSLKGSSTGAATVAELPLTSLAAPVSVVSIQPTNMATLNTPMASIPATAATITLNNFNGSTVAAMTDANFTNTSDLRLSGSYSV